MRFALIGLVILLLINCNMPVPGNTTNKGQLMPTFKIQLIDSISKISIGDFVKNEPIVLFFFDPDCAFCKRQLKNILINDKELSGIHIYMITCATFSKMKSFYLTMNLDKYKNITLGRDSDLVAFNFFQLTSVPFTVVYNKKREQISSFDHIVDAETIYKSIYN